VWVFDAAAGRELVLWGKEGGIVRQVRLPVERSFLFTLPDPALHWGMVEALESRFGARECRFRTVFGEEKGWEVFSGRRTAEEIERQSRYAAALYNVDVRAEQQYFARERTFPCSGDPSDRFSPEIAPPLSIARVEVAGVPGRDTAVNGAVFTGERREELRGSERSVVADLCSLVGSHDPDAILFPHADYWMQRIAERAAETGVLLPFSRSGRMRPLGSRSYWSYGRREYRPSALIPEGRLLIDTAQSFVYREGGIEGVLIASRLTGLSPNLTSRFTPGTLVSSYENCEALARGIAVPFRKSDPEAARSCAVLRAADRGGLIFQPEPGIFGPATQLDFTSMYPSIIVRHNLSPETIKNPEKPGFLAEALAPLLEFRVMTKHLKAADRRYAGTDTVLKWMLVTCFGYTGYRNAKFGQIEVHERITAIAREVLLTAKTLAEEAGFSVLHGIVDCIWVDGTETCALAEQIGRATGIPVEAEHYDWLVFLPQADGSGAYNRYYGRLSDGSIKTRGIAARKRETPGYVRSMQREILTLMAGAGTPAALGAVADEAAGIYSRYRDGLAGADRQELVIRRRISRLNYSRRCLESAAVKTLAAAGADIAPGMEIRYVVRDAKKMIVDAPWDAGEADVRYYALLLERAWEELAFTFRCVRKKPKEKSVPLIPVP
jgi:DNA polymerase I